MLLIFNIFLILHIVGGSIGLILGSINLILKKGTRLHKNLGKIFSFSMVTTGISAFVLSIMHPNYFLFMVGIFTVYLVGTGHRYIYLKMLDQHQVPKPIDWIISICMLLAGILFLFLGTHILVSGNLFGIVFLVFGLLGLRFVKQDYTNYRGKIAHKNYWILAHLQRMAGGYIAALTAFLVVNSNYLPKQIPGFLAWLLPTLILTPMIVYWSRKYER